MNLPPPPVARRKPHTHSAHGVEWSDEWHWLRDPNYPEVDDPDVLAYLTQENAYFDAVMAPHQPLVEEIFEEMKGRVKEDDATVPIRDGEWLYWSAFKTGTQYRLWYRRPVAGDDEALIYDENAEAEGKDYYRLGAFAVSPDGRRLATMVDDDGSERFKLSVRDLATGATIDTITEVGIGGPVWAADSNGLLFTEVNDQWRSYRAQYHSLGDDPVAAKTIYEETADIAFTVGLDRTTDRRFIVISTGNNSSTEVRLVPTDDPLAEPLLVRARQPAVQYEVDSAQGRLWILANDEHVNFRIASADPATPGNWKTEVAGSDQTYIRGVTSHRDHLLVTVRVDGLDQLLLRDYSGGDPVRVPFGEASYSAGFGGNPEYAPTTYRLAYSSMVTPGTTYDYHPVDQRLEVLKIQEIPSGYDTADYVTERRMIAARDGKQVPVSIVRRRDFATDGSGKLFVYAYGAYGFAIPPSFSTARLSMVDRGYAYAIAHIRGGDDLGYEWFLDGKLNARVNTFNDFVDVTRGLVDLGYAKPGRIAAEGRSAGGELMGAAVNQAGELYGAVIADVPFVDALNTMLDDTLPLTPGEWTEWGNPIEDSAAFELIRSYSPYDNVTAREYPAMLISGGLHDPRVTYWEPAKWAAKLRATKTDTNTLVLKINMGAGHGGKSGRWHSLHELAEAYAFVLTQIGE